MVLHVTHVVQAQLEDAEFSMRQNETLPRRFVRQTCDMGSAFFAGELEVHDQLGFAVNPLGQDFIGTGFVHREWRVRRERLWGFGQVKIQPEQRVVGDVPILEEVDLIAPNFFWAFLNGVLEHLNRCTELLPEDFSEGRVHVQSLRGDGPVSSRCRCESRAVRGVLQLDLDFWIARQVNRSGRRVGDDRVRVRTSLEQCFDDVDMPVFAGVMQCRPAVRVALVRGGAVKAQPFEDALFVAEGAGLEDIEFHAEVREYVRHGATAVSEREQDRARAEVCVQQPAVLEREAVDGWQVAFTDGAEELAAQVVGLRVTASGAARAVDAGVDARQGAVFGRLEFDVVTHMTEF
jgi:hypothetical protein